MAKAQRLMDSKETVTFRITKGLKARLELAARQAGTNMSQYTEMAIEEKLLRDNVGPIPDFRKRFGSPLKYHGPQTDIVAVLLQEREESL